MSPRLRGALLGLPVLLLIGCGGSSVNLHQAPPTAGDPAPTASANTPVFDPSTGQVPLPNILATATAVDPLTGTTNPGGAVTRLPNKPMTPPEALSYINYREMNGTNAVSGLNAPIYIRFANPVDPASLAGNVKVFQLTADQASGGLTENGPLGFTDVTALFRIKYTAGSTDLFLFPNFPLTPGTKYAYFVKDTVKDAATGKNLSASMYFSALRSTTPLTGTIFAALEPIRANVSQGPNVVLRGYASVLDDVIAATAITPAIGISSRSQVVLMGRFITTGAGYIVPNPASPTTRLPVETTLRQFAAGATLGGLSGKTWDNTVTITGNPGTVFVKGTAASPDLYWQAVTQNNAATAPASVGAVFLGSFKSGDLNVDPVVAKANAATMNLTGVTLGGAPAYNPAAGVTQAFRDNTGALTGYYHTDRTLNFVYIAPDTAAPAGGYPLVIYQHGITSQKETVIALAGALTAQGRAVIAIDLPLHGSNAVTGHTTGSSWGQDFMAVGAPLATRTNLQQAVVNLNRLEMALVTGNLDIALNGLGLVAKAPNRTTVKPRYVGVSLGSIVGVGYLASNTTLTASNPPYSQATLDNDMKGLLSVPGGRLAYLLHDSAAFGPSIDQGLAALGIAKNSVTYHQFFQVSQSVTDPMDPATLTSPLAAGLPSRLSGRVLVQEATTTQYDTTKDSYDGLGIAANGDTVIPNSATRYFGNALGGRGILGGAGAAVAPNFSQLSYTAGGALVVNGTAAAHAAGVPAAFMFTLNGATPAPKVTPAATSALATGPNEGYFQFDQTGIVHAFLLTPSPLLNVTLGQRQMMYFLGVNSGTYGVVGTTLAVDPTQQSVTLPIAPAEGLEPMLLQTPRGPIVPLAH